MYRYSHLTFICATLIMVIYAFGTVNANFLQDELSDTMKRRIDTVFSHFSNSTPGAALAVAKNGKILYKQGYGISNLEHDIPVTPSSIFHVASVSKEFSAMSIVLLHQQGRLSVDDDIRKYLPEVPDFGETITVRHLIHHTSGLRDQWDLFVLAGWRDDDVRTQNDVLEFVKRQKALNFTPNDEYLYSNTGYTLLAYIVQRVSGKSLREFADENIFNPLGMKNTHFHDNHAEIVKHRTQAYTPQEDGSLLISIPVFDTYGATSLFTTVEDLALWADNFRHKRVGGEGAINLMLTKGVLNNGEELSYAFGLSHGTYKGLRTIGHGGSDAGYRARFTMFPDHGVSIIVLTNISTGNPGRLVNQVAEIVFEEYIDESVQQPSARAEPRSEPEPTDPPVLTNRQLAEYEGTYYSDELDVFYTIELLDDILFLHTPTMRKDPVSVRETDVFIWKSFIDYEWETYRIQFTRGRQNKINGFKITKNRVRDVRFDKVDGN